MDSIVSISTLTFKEELTVLCVQTTQKWFQRFSLGDFSCTTPSELKLFNNLRTSTCYSDLQKVVGTCRKVQCLHLHQLKT
ncbi:hypothetical protein ABEB36_011110, partial [Hypothenemus hampei]